MTGERGSPAAGWTVETLEAHFQLQIDNLRKLLDERYATQTKIIDQGFADQKLATKTALEAAERAVDRALLAAEKAVLKAETASDKRFDSQNEFRGQLADQQSTFITRAEALAAIERNTERVTDLTDRLNRSEGKGVGLNSGWLYLLGAVAAIGTVVSLYLALKGG